MRNPERWKPSKFVIKNGELAASTDRQYLGVASRLAANAVARCYGESLKLHAKGRLLDLGCGMVPFYAAYKDFVADTVCVDWENTLHANDHVDYEVDLTKALPFADHEFDTIILSDVLEHLPTPEDLWREMTRVLAKGGKILLNVPFLYPLHEQPHDYYRYTEYAIRRFVNLSGLQLVTLQPVGGAFEVMVDIFAKNIVRLPLFGHLLAMSSQSVAWWFSRTKAGAKLKRMTGSSFPLGYFVIAEKRPTSVAL